MMKEKIKTSEYWRGVGGDEYTKRQAGGDWSIRAEMWANILDFMDHTPKSVLEVGCGTGANLLALERLIDLDCFFAGTDINPSAIARTIANGFSAELGDAKDPFWPNMKFDLVVTCGLLMHIHPGDLDQVCTNILNASSRYIAIAEYFSDKLLEEVPYRGENGLLWKRDWGAYWLDNFEVECRGYGFCWKRMTGLDNITWWLLEKKG